MGRRKVEKIFTKSKVPYNAKLRDDLVNYGRGKAMFWFIIGVIIITVLFLYLADKQ